jgi:hypothetical protein
MLNYCLEESFETISQVAFRLHISRQAVHLAIKQGRLDALPIGDIFLITKGAIIQKRNKSKTKERYPQYILRPNKERNGR